jgi:sterol desaturase/sphingolipid hydroxylase (fatty acid hydroxylase superfamily)
MILSVIVSIVLTDLAYYWTHRAQHAIPFLWRFHAMHHSINDLSALNNYSHWTENGIQVLFKVIPVALLIKLNPGYLGVIAGGLVSLHQSYIHSTSRFNFGRFSWLINDNVRHRIHHSVEPKHFDKNFGIEFGFWDHLFGTAYTPAPNEWPDTGLDQIPEPDTFRMFFTWYFLGSKSAEVPQPIRQTGQ